MDKPDVLQVLAEKNVFKLLEAFGDAVGNTLDTEAAFRSNCWGRRDKPPTGGSHLGDPHPELVRSYDILREKLRALKAECDSGRLDYSADVLTVLNEISKVASSMFRTYS